MGDAADISDAIIGLKAVAMISIDVNLRELPTPSIDDDVIQSWIETRLDDAKNTFLDHIGTGTGQARRTYRRMEGGTLRETTPTIWPQSETNTLARSIDVRMTGARDGSLFSDVAYAGFLTSGTVHMAARQMLASARDEVLTNSPRRDLLASAAKFI